MATSLAGVLASFGWGLALGFAMAVSSAASLAILASVPGERLQLKVESSQNRTFKGNNINAVLHVGTGSYSTPVELELVKVPEGLDARLVEDEQGHGLIVGSKFAGAFVGLAIRVGIGDPLGIFARYQTHELPLVFEFLPTSLLAKREPIVVSAAMLGDYPAGRSGFGQEFYTAERYSMSHSSKDILWKRQAKLDYESLMVRVGEANIPEKLTVCLIERAEMLDRERPSWMDLASEAVARIGVPVVASGTTIRLVHVVNGEATVSEAKDVAGLAYLVTWLWRKDLAKEETREKPSQSDIVIIGETNLREPRTQGLVLEKPSIILSWGGRRPAVLGSKVVFFTGREEISELVARVLSK